ncbi:serine/threonine-protein phosphatase, partial [bacterium]|nr:serine/threonine-protein phosphatase [bacterium]
MSHSLSQDHEGGTIIVEENMIFNPSTASSLVLAHQVHQALLNSVSFKQLPLPIATWFETAEKIGGDFWVSFSHTRQEPTLMEHHPGIMTLQHAPQTDMVIGIGDVAGHGVAAALIMALSVGIITQLSQSNGPLDALMAAYNQDLTRHLSHLPARYVTCLMTHIQLDRLLLTYVRAGHPPLMMVRDRQVMTLDAGDPMVGMYPDETFTAHTVALQPGDRLVLYSDGITEAHLPDRGHPFGMDGLMAFLA